MLLVGAGVGMLMQNLVLVVQNTVRSARHRRRQLAGRVLPQPRRRDRRVACSARCSRAHASSSIAAGLAALGIDRRRPRRGGRCPTCARCPPPVAARRRARLRHGRRRDLPGRGAARARRPRRGRADARGAAGRQERHRASPASEERRARRRRPLMSQPRARRAAPPPPARRHRRLGQRRARAGGGRHGRAARPRGDHADRGLPGRARHRELAGAPRRRPATQEDVDADAQADAARAVERIPEDIPVTHAVPPRQGRARDRRRPKRQPATTTRSSSAPAASVAWAR